MKHNNRTCKKALKKIFADKIGCKPNQLRLGHFYKHAPTYLFSDIPNPNHCWVWYKGKCYIYNLVSLVRVSTMVMRLLPDNGGCMVLHLEKKKCLSESDSSLEKITLSEPIRVSGNWVINELKIKFK